MTGLFYCLPTCTMIYYCCYSAQSASYGVRKGGISMRKHVLSFVKAIAASVVAYYVCKWLDALISVLQSN